MFGNSNFALLIAVLAVAVLVPTVSSAGLRAAYIKDTEIDMRS